MSNLSGILELRFAPDCDLRSTQAFLSYKRLQDNRKAKQLFNGFMFYGKSLEFQVGTEVEVDVSAGVIESKSVATQTWIMS